MKDHETLPEMTEEQVLLFEKLTRLQRRICINVLSGMKGTEAYKKAGGKAKDVSMGACEILANPNVNRFMQCMERQAARAALCTTEDIVKGLMKECGIGKDQDGEQISPPSDATQTGRVSAFKALSDFTGGFDANKQQIEHSGYIQTSTDELYGDD